MADLKTTYMGKELANPIIVGACSLTSDIDRIKRIADQGAGALVIKSLFQEQVELEKMKLSEEMHEHDNLYPEMLDFFNDLEHGGPKEHLMWVRRAREAVDMPIFASLNAFEKDVWVEYAKKLADTGVDGLELNLFNLPKNDKKDSNAIESEQIEALEAVKKAVDIPIAAKISHFYTDIVGFVKRLDDCGVDGFVLFNKLFQPDFSIETEENIYPFNLSSPRDLRLPLRYTGLLHGKIDADICSSTGILNGKDAVKMIMAGANCVQMVTALYQNGIESISGMIDDIGKWMDKKGHKTLEDFKGKKDAENNSDTWFYDRAQYVRILMKGDPEIYEGMKQSG